MDRIVVRGGVPLRGEVSVGGSKNAALPLLFATLLTEEECRLDRVPRQPLRLIVPGWYGIANVKWLKRIEVLNQPFVGEFEAGHYMYQWADKPPERERNQSTDHTRTDNGDAVARLRLRGHAFLTLALFLLPLKFLLLLTRTRLSDCLFNCLLSLLRLITLTPGFTSLRVAFGTATGCE
jgi:hypothetical protein